MTTRWRRRDALMAAAMASGSWVLGARAGEEAALVQHSSWPQDLSTPLSALDQLITPTRAFFVRSHFGPPALNRERRFTASGTRGDLSFGLDDLRQFERVTVTCVLQCFGNGRGSQVPHAAGIQWSHGAVGQATWTGVRLRDVLEKAGVPSGARWVRLQGADAPPLPATPPFVRGMPLEKAMDASTLIATHMNGEPLTLNHGAPFRVAAPSWVGGHWVKWLKSVRAQADEPEGFFFQNSYRVLKAPVATGAAVKPEELMPATAFPVKSVIARPSEGAALRAGEPIAVVGMAFSGVAPVAKVEVSADGGATFSPASLEGEPGAGRAQLFRASLSLPAGTHVLLARATDGAGNVQPKVPDWSPGGWLWNGWHAVRVEVTA